MTTVFTDIHSKKLLEYSQPRSLPKLLQCYKFLCNLMHFAHLFPEVIVILGAGSQQDIAKKLIAEQQEMPVEDVWRVVQCPSFETAGRLLSQGMGHTILQVPGLQNYVGTSVTHLQRGGQRFQRIH